MTVLNATHAVAQLPAHVGADQVVAIRQDGSGDVVQAATVSFRRPEIAALTSDACSSTSSTELENCPRPGNVTITIAGSFFGPAVPGDVTVGGVPCVDVARATTPNFGEAISCTLSKGFLTRQTVPA